MSRVTETLTPVRFYTSLDPYYYTVDNRPLEDLNSNLALVAAASDTATGGANRNAMAAASLAHTMLGYGTVGADIHNQGQGMFSGTYSLVGLNINVEHGFMVYPEGHGGDPIYIEPRIAVHDSAVSISPAVARAGILQVTSVVTTNEDRVGAEDFPVRRAVLSWKQGTSPSVFPAPDPGSFTLMKVDVPADAVSMKEEYIELVNFKDVNQTANVLAEAKLGYNSLVVNMTSGTQNVSLTGSDIDITNMESVEVFVQGVNQFNWTYNNTHDYILLNAPLTDAAEVRVRQTNISLA